MIEDDWFGQALRWRSGLDIGCKSIGYTGYYRLHSCCSVFSALVALEIYLIQNAFTSKVKFHADLTDTLKITSVLCDSITCSLRKLRGGRPPRALHVGCL
jgi:hypothetical protein